MKLFKTNNTEIVKECQEFFGFQLPSVQIAKRTTVRNSISREVSSDKVVTNSNTSNFYRPPLLISMYVSSFS